jgi:hypothetical protein
MKKKCKFINVFKNKQPKKDLDLKDILMSNLTLQELSSEMLCSLLESCKPTPAIFVAVENEIINRLHNSVKANVFEARPSYQVNAKK